MVEGERGDLNKALGFIARGTEPAEKVDNKACALVGHFVMGDQQLRLGLPEEALRSFERSTEIAAYILQPMQIEIPPEPSRANR